jgi:hypothetical protein
MQPPRTIIDTNQLDGMSAQIDELTAENKSLLELKEIQERKIASLNIDLGKKSRETRKLHEIIIQSGHNDSEVTDEDIIKEFGTLSFSIMRIVKKHFSSPPKTRWRQHNSMTPDDHEFLVRATIADRMYSQLFQSSVGLFGLDSEHEKHQIELENKLLDHKGSRSLCISWTQST